MTDKMGELILEQLFKMQEVMVTKDDLKNFATKDDIKNMATKDDIKNMATKDDIKNMATKDDLKDLEKRMDTKFATKDDLKDLEKCIDAKFEEQTRDIADAFHTAFETSERIHKMMEERTDRKIQKLRNEFILYSNANQ